MTRRQNEQPCTSAATDEVKFAFPNIGVIDLFVCDIDGCLAVPYAPYDLGSLREMAQLAAEAGAVGGAHPAVSLCSGRPYSYVEAMAQVLGLRVPVLFESGGGLFDPVSTATVWNPRFTEEDAAALEEVRAFMLREALPGTAAKLDYAKRTQAGLVGPDTAEIERIFQKVRQFVAGAAPHLRVYDTHVSVDVLLPGLTKNHSLRWLAEEAGTTLGRLAYIGDTDGDIEALEAAGHSFAPANATPGAKAAAQHVTEGRVIGGTLEAYRWCMAHNDHQLASAS